MKKAAEFFVDYLVEDPRSEERWLISGPSNSPELGGLVMGPTMDHQIIRALFGYCIRASEILDVDAEFRRTLEQMRSRIAPNQIGRLGQLQEWLEDKDDPKEKHRHVSHLWGCILARRLRGTARPIYLRPLASRLSFAATAARAGRWAGRLISASTGRRSRLFMLSNQLTPERTLRTCLTPIRRSRLTATSGGQRHCRDAVAVACRIYRIATGSAEGMAVGVYSRPACSRRF